MDVLQEDLGGHETRYTVHLFDIENPSILGRIPSGSQVRVPADNVNWPPDVLFDASYASAVFHHFHATGMEDAVMQWLKEFYPPSVPMTDEQMQQQHQTADESDDGSSQELDIFDMLRFLPYIRMSPTAKREYDDKRRDELEAKRLEALGAKVNLWRDRLPTPVGSGLDAELHVHTAPNGANESDLNEREEASGARGDVEAGGDGNADGDTDAEADIMEAVDAVGGAAKVEG